MYGYARKPKSRLTVSLARRSGIAPQKEAVYYSPCTATFKHLTISTVSQLRPSMSKLTPKKSSWVVPTVTPKKSTAASAKAAPKKSASPAVPRPKKTSVSADIRKDVAANLKEWMRADQNLDTQVKVSVASGVGQTTVSRILKGTTAATADVLDAIARAFGKDPGDLLTARTEHKIQYDVSKVKRLPEYEKARIEAFIKHVLVEYEHLPDAASKKKTIR